MSSSCDYSTADAESGYITTLVALLMSDDGSYEPIEKRVFRTSASSILTRSHSLLVGYHATMMIMRIMRRNWFILGLLVHNYGYYLMASIGAWMWKKNLERNAQGEPSAIGGTYHLS